MDLTLYVWRQSRPQEEGRMERHDVRGITPDMSFLEMLDVVNIGLAREGKEPVAFDHDCREGICGTCSQMIDGVPHGPQAGTTVCQLHMRHFRDGDVIRVEPWRARAFPVIRDLVVDRSALDRIVEAGGYVSVDTGGVPDANAVAVPKEDAEDAMDAASCIACGACVAACPNASAMLFTGAKIAHLAKLPQGRVEAARRARSMVEAMDRQGFGYCTNHYECEAVCPKSISVEVIARMNRDFHKGIVRRKR